MNQIEELRRRDTLVKKISQLKDDDLVVDRHTNTEMTFREWKRANPKRTGGYK